jgi:hypothetical protein
MTRIRKIACSTKPEQLRIESSASARSCTSSFTTVIEVLLQEHKANAFYQVATLSVARGREWRRKIGVRIAVKYPPSPENESFAQWRVVMSAGLKLTGLLMAGILCLPIAGRADTQTPHRVHKVKKQPPPLPPPLPSGPQGPVPQVPLDAIPAVAPQVSYQDGLLTIIAPNSTLADVLRSVRKHTAADIEIPTTATERVVTRLGPGPAREVMAELLNGSHFNYILLGSAEDATALVRVVLVAKSGPDDPTTPPGAGNKAASSPPTAEAADAADTTEDATDDTPEQGTAEAEPPAAAPTPDQPDGAKTPQQLLQEMQQRQLQLQQQQQQPGQQGVFPTRPGAAIPQTPPQPDQQ